MDLFYSGYQEGKTMSRMSSKEKAEFRKSMAQQGYSRISIYAPTNAKELRADILEVANKMVEDYEARVKAIEAGQ